MAIARGVGPTFATSSLPGTTVVLTLNGTTAARMLVIGIDFSTSGSPTISSVTISGESNATLIAGSFATLAGMSESAQIAVLPNITSGGNKTITVTFSAPAYASVGVMEYSGQDTASQPDNSTNTSGFDASGATSCNTTITTAANALIVALGSNNGQPMIAGSGYTLWGALPDSGGGYNEIQDQIFATGAGSKAVAFTNPYNNSIMAVASFNPAGGGGAANWGRLLGMETNRLVRVVG